MISKAGNHAKPESVPTQESIGRMWIPRVRALLTDGIRKMYTYRTMGRLVWLGMVLLAMIAIATVLVTPDPTDDVSGLLNSAHIHLLPSSNGSLALAVLNHTYRVALPQTSIHQDFSHLIDSICVRLC